MDFNIWVRLEISSILYRLIGAIQLGEQYKGLPTNDYTLHSVGVDEGFGSSSTAVVVTEFLKEERKIRVLYAEEFEHANPQDIVDLCFNLYRKHWNTWFWVMDPTEHSEFSEGCI